MSHGHPHATRRYHRPAGTRSQPCRLGTAGSAPAFLGDSAIRRLGVRGGAASSRADAPAPGHGPAGVAGWPPTPLELGGCQLRFLQGRGRSCGRWLRCRGGRSCCGGEIPEPGPQPSAGRTMYWAWPIMSGTQKSGSSMRSRVAIHAPFAADRYWHGAWASRAAPARSAMRLGSPQDTLSRLRGEAPTVRPAAVARAPGALRRSAFALSLPGCILSRHPGMNSAQTVRLSKTRGCGRIKTCAGT